MIFLLKFLSVLVVFFGVVNLFRMAIFLIGSDIYGLKKHLQSKKDLSYYPYVSIIIPAYNEERSVIGAISSVITNTYPQDKVEVIVVSDGSTDGTEQQVKDFIAQYSISNVRLVTQINSGKANALNNGMKNFATGELVMCLDADSYIAPDALVHAVIYFEDEKVMAMASNVKVVRSKGLLNLIQVFEYIICYQMKKAQTAFNIEYIIGGIGSMFRRSFLEQIDFYDGNTVTEDIDLTMKILQYGNKNIRVIYASDVLAYTQGALSISDLMRQRHRWKWGRYQTFLKNRHLFFSKDTKYTKGFSWIYLPFALFCDFAFFFEPFILLFILYLIIGYHDSITLLSAVCVLSFYMSMSILGEDTISIKNKFQLILLAPLMYFFFYLLSFVEYFALIKSWLNLHQLGKSLSQNKASWQPIRREGFAVSVVQSYK